MESNGVLVIVARNAYEHIAQGGESLKNGPLWGRALGFWALGPP